MYVLYRTTRLQCRATSLGLSTQPLLDDSLQMSHIDIYLISDTHGYAETLATLEDIAPNEVHYYLIVIVLILSIVKLLSMQEEHCFI